MIQFIKSTQSTYDSLVTKDIDALYFIEPSYNEHNVIVSPGRIYRGEILIAESNELLQSTIQTLTAGILELSASYGVCETEGSVANKIVACDYFKLREGIKITVKFTHSNTAEITTLNVNNTGAKYITMKGSSIKADSLEANRIYDFVYDGTNYELVSGGGVVETPDFTNTDTSVDVVLTNGDRTYLLGTQKVPSAENQSTTAVADSQIYIEADGNLIAKLFKGSLDGMATKAYADEDNNRLKDTYAKLNSPALTGNPTAPTKEVSDDSTSIATTAFVQSLIKSGLTGVANGLIFKGALEGELIDDNNKYGALTPMANLGDFYKVSYAGYINGIQVEVGDVFICSADTVNAATPTNYASIQNKWVVLQNNVDLATTTTPGLISPEMFSKLNTLDFNAEENQNAFSKIFVNNKDTVVEATAKEGNFALVAGAGISLSTNINGDTITIAAVGEEHNGETYTFEAEDNGNNSVKLKLTDSEDKTQFITIKGTQGASVKVDSDGAVSINVVGNGGGGGGISESKNVISANPTDKENGISQNGVYINHMNGEEIVSSHAIIGMNGIKVMSDEYGNITLNTAELQNLLTWKELT